MQDHGRSISRRACRESSAGRRESVAPSSTERGGAHPDRESPRRKITGNYSQAKTASDIGLLHGKSLVMLKRNSEALTALDATPLLKTYRR